jgi:hypothetical protein
MSANDVIARLRELRAKATAGPWEVDTFSVLDDFGVYSAHAVFDPKGKVLLDTSNSEIQVIHNDRDGEGGSRWDETGRRDLTAIVAAMNSLPALLACAEALEGVLRTYDDPADPLSNVAFERDVLLVERARAALDALAGGGE